MTKLFVGNLASDVTDAELRAAFAAYGAVGSAYVVTDRLDGVSRGFGFVEMQRSSHATAAMEALDGALLRGRKINVGPARRQGDDRAPSSAGWAVVGSARHRW